MDCLEGLKSFPNGIIDLTITSPPYDNLRAYNGHSSFNFNGIAKELYRVTSDGGVLVWVVNDQTKNFCESLTSFKQAIYFVEECGFNLLDTMIYMKNGGPIPYPSLRRYGSIFEYMFVFSKGKPKTFNPIKDRENKAWGKIKNGYTTRQYDGSMKKGKPYVPEQFGIRRNVWIYNVGWNNDTKDKIALKHPARFPELLVQDHLLSWSNEGDLVLDPFMGSGTVAKVCMQNNRRFIGFEISKEYYDIIIERLKAIS